MAQTRNEMRMTKCFVIGNGQGSLGAVLCGVWAGTNHHTQYQSNDHGHSYSLQGVIALRGSVSSVDSKM